MQYKIVSSPDSTSSRTIFSKNYTSEFVTSPARVPDGLTALENTDRILWAKEQKTSQRTKIKRFWQFFVSYITKTLVHGTCPFCRSFQIFSNLSIPTLCIYFQYHNSHVCYWAKYSLNLKHICHWNHSNISIFHTSCSELLVSLILTVICEDASWKRDRDYKIRNHNKSNAEKKRPKMTSYTWYYRQYPAISIAAAVLY